MSRTYKDKPYKFVNPEQDWDYRHIGTPHTREYRVYSEGCWKWVEYDTVYWLKKPGVLTKKKKHKDTEHHWMGTPGHWTHTPSHWTHIMMNRPQRARENQSLRCIYDLEDFDFVDTGRKPHIYYW
jgi:hypothetical protein